MRRSLADPYSLSDVLAVWEPPAALPERTTLKGAIAELERSLVKAPDAHQKYCLAKLGVMAARPNTAMDNAIQADNFIDVCGHFPTDLWTAATMEILQTKTFRPAPAELFGIINPKYEQRRRMLDRAKWMLNPAGQVTHEPEKPLATANERIAHSIAVFTRLGMRSRAEAAQDKLDRLEGRDPKKRPPPDLPEPTERKPFIPSKSPTAVRCAELARIHHQRQLRDDEHAKAVRRARDAGEEPPPIGSDADTFEPTAEIV